MSNQDSFITEVSDEVRRDRLYKLFRKYGWIGALLIVVIVGGAAWNEWRKANIAAEAQAAGDAIFAAMQEQDPDARAEALSALDAGDNASRAAILTLLRADTALDAGNRDAALDLLGGLADSTEVPQAFRDLATLKWTILGAGELDADDRIGRLNSIAHGAGAFRLLALEQIALIEVERGNTDAALGHLNDIIADAGVTQDLRVRATQLIVALGGDPVAG